MRVALAFLALLAPIPIHGQACLGSPAAVDTSWLSVGVASMDAGVGFSAGIGRRFGSSIAAGLRAESWDHDDLPERVVSAGAQAAYVLGTETGGVCVVGSALYTRGMLAEDVAWPGVSGPITISQLMHDLTVPVGLAAGIPLGASSRLVLIPSVEAGALITRRHWSGELRRHTDQETIRWGGTERISRTFTDLYGNAGASVGYGRVFGRFSVGADTFAESAAELRFAFGVLL